MRFGVTGGLVARCEGQHAQLSKLGAAAVFYGIDAVVSQCATCEQDPVL